VDIYSIPLSTIPTVLYIIMLMSSYCLNFFALHAELKLQHDWIEQILGKKIFFKALFQMGENTQNYEAYISKGLKFWERILIKEKLEKWTEKIAKKRLFTAKESTMEIDHTR
jgi:hypothetical protein